MSSFAPLLLLPLVASSFAMPQFDPNFGDDLAKSIENSMKPLENLGQRIEQQVQMNLKPLDNLGAQIEQQVQESLKPLHVLMAQSQIKNGYQGVTVATLNPSNKKFIIRNSVRYECKNGEITDKLTCTGEEVVFRVKNKEDYCFRQDGFAIINNNICIPSTGNGVSVISINNKVECKNADGTPALMMSNEEYNKMCKDIATSITYDYLTNGKFNNPENKLDCQGTGPTRCKFIENIDPSKFQNGAQIYIGSGDNINVNFSSN